MFQRVSGPENPFKWIFKCRLFTVCHLFGVSSLTSTFDLPQHDKLSYASTGHMSMALV